MSICILQLWSLSARWLWRSYLVAFLYFTFYFYTLPRQTDEQILIRDLITRVGTPVLVSISLGRLMLDGDLRNIYRSLHLTDDHLIPRLVTAGWSYSFLLISPTSWDFFVSETVLTGYSHYSWDFVILWPFIPLTYVYVEGNGCSDRHPWHWCPGNQHGQHIVFNLSCSSTTFSL